MIKFGKDVTGREQLGSRDSFLMLVRIQLDDAKEDAYVRVDQTFPRP